MPALIGGVAGGSGSGKSTVARKVAELLTDISVASVSMDAYYRNMTHLTFDERKQLNWDHPDVVDMELLGDQLEALAGGAAIGIGRVRASVAGVVFQDADANGLKLDELLLVASVWSWAVIIDKLWRLGAISRSAWSVARLRTGTSMARSKQM